MQRPQGPRNRLGPTAPTPRRRQQPHWRRPTNQKRGLAPAPELDLEHGPGPGLEQLLALEMEPEPEPESLAVQEQV